MAVSSVLQMFKQLQQQLISADQTIRSSFEKQIEEIKSETVKEVTEIVDAGFQDGVKYEQIKAEFTHWKH